MLRLRSSIVVIVLGQLCACGGDDEGDDGNVSTSGPATTSGVPGTSSGADDDDGGSSGADDGLPGSSSTSDGSSGAPADSSGGASSGGASEGSGSETAAAGPTWDSFASGFFETYCWECHGPGDALRDYSMLADVMAEADAIRCGTAPVGSALEGCEGQPPAGQFPIGDNLPTDDERTMLVEWIDAGTP